MLKSFRLSQRHYNAGAARSFSTTAGNVLPPLTTNLAQQMHKAGVKRGYVITDPNTGDVVSSHQVLDPIADFLRQDQTDYDKHEGMFFEAAPYDTLLGAFLWRTNRGQGCGGIRFRAYDSTEDYIRDGMRLALGMGRKSALAGLYWGGGKGVIAVPEPPKLSVDQKEEILHLYGGFLSSLRGCYVAAEDAGMSVSDIDKVFTRTRFTTCISPHLGGSGNPSVPTAHGIVAAMEACLEFLGNDPKNPLAGKRIAVQGTGNVGGPMIGMLLEKQVAKVIATDPNPEKIAEYNAMYGGSGKVELHLVDPHSSAEQFDIFAQDVDVLSPCAYGGVLNEDSVPRIRAKVVCGAANNQLLDPVEDYGMKERGILYCPDFVANRMGIVNCANEQYGSVGESGAMKDPMVVKHLKKEEPGSVYNTVMKVLKLSEEKEMTPGDAANHLADEMAAVPHPIFGHRGQDIITSLVEDGNWATPRS